MFKDNSNCLTKQNIVLSSCLHLLPCERTHSSSLSTSRRHGFDSEAKESRNIVERETTSSQPLDMLRCCHLLAARDPHQLRRDAPVSRVSLTLKGP